jgi:hypothetical protein
MLVVSRSPFSANLNDSHQGNEQQDGDNFNRKPVSIE